MLKNPVDLLAYRHILDTYNPKSVVEVGTFAGGFALWLSDYLPGATIYSFDLENNRDKSLRNQKQNNINFLTTDILLYDLSRLHHPVLFIDDASHFYELTKKLILYFDMLGAKDDLMVIEDGSIIEAMEESQKYNGGPSRAIQEVLISGEAGKKWQKINYVNTVTQGLSFNQDGWWVKVT